MIDIFVGKPRNGKSLRAMMRILKTLVETQRYVVTNMVLDLDRIQDYLDKRGVKTNAHQRILILTSKEQMKHFWLYREFGVVLVTPPDYNEKTGGDVDYAPLVNDQRFWLPAKEGHTPVMRGTLYVIDEIHTLFPARGWQGTPRHADFYNSQHAKLNDECVFITQNTKLVDPNFYRLAQEFHYCRNHRLMKHGRFKGANKFTVHIHDGPASTGKEPTLNVEEFKLDLEVACCYDTSAGVGMPGGGAADAGARTKGIPLWMVWAVIGFCIGGVYWFFNYEMPKLTNKYLTSAVKHGTLKPGSGSPVGAPGVPAVVSQSVPGAAPQGAKPATEADYPLESIYEDTKPEKPLYATGYVVRGKHVNVQLSDGRILTEHSPELLTVERNAVILRGGQRLYFLSYKPREAPKEPVQPIETVSPDQAGDSLPPPPSPPAPAWVTHSDGVSRLVTPPVLGK
ncbi:MAG: zonular occludens toxin domain-containing protein [Opitutaceae bacterium]|jgi:hypothetical protein